MAIDTLASKCLNSETINRLSSLRGEPEWMVERRKRALGIINSLSLPESRYTRIRGFNPDIINPLSEGDIEKLTFNVDRFKIYGIQADTSFKTFVPDEYRDKIIFTSLAYAIVEHRDILRDKIFSNFKFDKNIFTALHVLLLNAGVFLYLADDVELDIPVYILNEVQGENAGIFSHSIIILGRNSSLTFVEENHSGDRYSVVTNITEIFASEGSRINFFSLNNFGASIYNYIERIFKSEKDSVVNWISGWFGGKVTFSRHESILDKPGAESRDVQIVFGDRDRIYDLTSYTKHISSYTRSNSVIRGVLKDRARAAFYGLVDIEEDAHNSDSYLSEHAMLLNPGARANAVPSLQIKNANVRAGHGATVGQIDEEQVFYLMTRGLNESEARRIIVEGFLLPAFDEIKIDFVRGRIQEVIHNKWNTLT